ncbi:MAG: Ig-like domain-containing protein [Planctomycetota bacterium]
MRHVSAGLACTLFAVAGCHGGGGGGEKSGRASLTDLAGLGGGIVIADVFPGAVITRPAPFAVAIAPAENQPGLSTIGAPAVLFDESMNVRSADPSKNLRVRDAAGNTVPCKLYWSHEQQLAVLLPKSPLAPGDYTVVIDPSLTDLTGHSFATASDTPGRVTSAFRVGAQASALSVLLAAPQSGQTNVFRGTTIALVFSEPVATGGGAGAIDAPGNLQVRVGSSAVAGTIKVRAKGRLVEFTPAEAMPRDVVVDVSVSNAVRARSGLALNGGFATAFRTIGFASTDELSFPGNSPITRPVAADGFIANRGHAPKLHAFDLHAASEGASAIGMFLVDPDLQGGNGFRFEHSGATLDLAPDLQPEPVAALGDGIVKVGGYAVKNGVTGPIDRVSLLYKDSNGAFNVVELGPPNGTETQYTDLNRLLAIRTRDSAVWGTLDTPYGPFQLLSTNDTGFPGPALNFPPALYRGIRHLAGSGALPNQTTFDDGDVTENVFLTTPPSSELPAVYDPLGLDFKKGQDAFGNEGGKVDLTKVAVVEIGVIGGQTTRCLNEDPGDDPDFCLYVSVLDQDALKPIASDELGNPGADILLERFPPDGTQLAPRSSPTTFAEEDFATLGNPERLTVTIIKDGYHVVSYAGIPNPVVAQRPLGIHAMLEPAARGVGIPVSAAGDASLKLRLAGNEVLLSDADERFTPEGNPASFTSLTWNPQHLKALVGLAVDGSGYRLAADLPRIRDEGAMHLDFTKARFFDTSNAATITVLSTESDADASHVYDDKKELDLIEVRLNAHLPGFTGVVPIFFDTKLSITGDPDIESKGEVLLPHYFLRNKDGAQDPGRDDSPLELIVQPSLAGAGASVSPADLRRVFHTEYILRNTDGRLTVQRSPIDFSNLFAPRAVFEQSHLPHLPTITTSGPIAHPPLLTWSHEIAREGLYVTHLLKRNGFGSSDRRWDVYLPASDEFASAVQYPVLNPAMGFKNSVADFADPGTYGFVIDSIGFDVDDPNDASDDGTVQFSFDAFLLGEIEQRFATRTRTARGFDITTQ